jgi:hypothetical protein
MGKSIRIYLPNESVSGIRHGEIANWSGQALACPRSRFQELRDWPEVQRPGVYFLFGVDDETGEDVAYIGEAEMVIDRVSSHLSGKNFWTELVAFTSKDENLTKAHVRYLESRLVAMARDAARYQIENTATPQLPSLPRADRDAMEDFLDSTRTLLGVLGHKVLDSLVIRPATAKQVVEDPIARPIAQIPMSGSANIIEPSPVFHLHVSDLTARAVRTDEGIVVFKGSEAVADASKSLTGGQLALRQSLIESGILIQSGRKFRLMHDHLFKSPSQAGAVLAGYSINGREYWRLDDGTTYSKYEASLTAI